MGEMFGCQPLLAFLCFSLSMIFFLLWLTDLVQHDWQCVISPLAGIWIKPTRTSRMREKRADFVAGCLGGRVIAAGGLGQHLHSFSLSLCSFLPIRSNTVLWPEKERKKGETEQQCRSSCDWFPMLQHLLSANGQTLELSDLTVKLSVLTSLLTANQTPHTLSYTHTTKLIFH